MHACPFTVLSQHPLAYLPCHSLDILATSTSAACPGRGGGTSRTFCPLLSSTIPLSLSYPPLTIPLSLPHPFSLSPSHKSLSLLVATFVGVNQRARVPTLRGLRESSRIETTMIMSCTVPDVYAAPLFTLFCHDRYGIATVFLP